jgi:hypothetical protein
MDMTQALRAGVPITTALLLLVITIAARKDPPRVAQPSVEPPFCELMTQDGPTVPAHDVPGADVYATLEKCLRDRRHPWHDGPTATVAQVRYWVEVEHDPAWFENGAWWLPLSGEGDARWPSGVYISVPLDGRDCRAAIVN